MAKALKKKRGGGAAASKGSLSSNLTVKRKAKTLKGRRILAARESEAFPEVKSLLLMRGGRCSPTLQELLADLRDLKKPQAVYLSQRKQQDLHPFEDAEPIEYLARKNGCGVFAFASSSKKRPSRLVLGRVYEHELLDMTEFSVSHYVPAASFTNRQAPRAGSAPLVLLQGGSWEATEELKNLRNLFGDLFRGVAAPPDGPPQKLFLSGIDRLIAISAVQCSAATQPAAAPAATATTAAAAATAANNDGETAEAGPATAIGKAPIAAASAATAPGASGVLICIRHYRVVLLRSEGSSSPRVQLEEVGPQIDLKLDRVRLPSGDKWRSATKTLERARAEEKRAKQKAAEADDAAAAGPQKKKSKNVKTNVFGDIVGRVFVDKPDLTRLKQVQSPLLHKLQRAEALQRKQAAAKNAAQ